MSRADLPAWLATYAVHSTLLIGTVWLLVRRGVIRSHHLQDTFWKAALLGGLLTATAQMALGIRPQGSVAIQAAQPSLAPTTLINRGAGDGAAADQARDRLQIQRPASELPPAPASVGPAPALHQSVQQEGVSRPAPHPVDILPIIWMALAALFVLQLVVARFRLSWRIGPREPLTGSPLDAHVSALRRAAGIRRPIRLTAAEGLASPIALGRSEICIPRAVLTDLDAAQQRSVLAHELAHLTRLDPVWLTAACVIERAFFFQPLNRLARRRMQETAEYLCDDWAVGRTGSGLTMAKSLVKVAEWMHTPALPLPLSGMAETPSQLVARVKRLVDNREPAQARRRWQVPAAFAVVGVTAVMAPGVMPAAQPAGAPAAHTVQDTTPRRARRTPAPDIPVVVNIPRIRVSPTPLPTPVVNGAMRTAVAAALRDVRPIIAGARRSQEPQDTARNAARVAALIAALRDSDAEVRRAAANSLGQLEDKRAVTALAAALRDSDAEVRSQSAWALGQLEDKRAVEPLTAALRDENVEVRRKAAWALGQLEDESAAAGLAAALRDADADVRKTAAWSLGQLELETAPPALIEALHDQNADVRRTAAWAVSEMGDARAVPALREMLNDTDADARRNAIHALGQIRDSTAMQAIIGAMQSKDAEIRRAAAQALGDR
ncbi:MAG TPA: M56 family metallopeptidase [Gemmatimonadales bacterium]|jgi:HEAT repeat protein/beta-lactamase regulating signal transducer with metallopeptidase domain|nr:M56 family metallopeptidase [Gemmatimonadales bacterium]